MSKMIAVFTALFVTAMALGTAPSTASATTVHDLTADWSNANNPNGVWSYNEGNNPLPFLPNWGSGIGAGWGRNQESTNPFVPVWYMSTGTETFGNDIQAGDVGVHTTDGSGSGQGPANVTWTATFNGTVDITGHVYMGRDIGRGNRWGLSLNNAEFTNGNIVSGDIYNSANPFDFTLGSGGPGVLQNIPVSVGDVLKLEFLKTTHDGDFVVSSLTITAEPNVVPVPAALWSALPLGLAVVSRGRRHGRA